MSELAAVRDFVCDLGELVRAGVRELHRHDRLAGRGVEVLARAVELQVLAGHLRDGLARLDRLFAAVVADQVVRVARRICRADARADVLADPAAEDGRVGRNAEDAPPLRQRARFAGSLDRVRLEQLVLVADGPGAHLLLVVEEVPGRVRAVLDERLLAGEESVERLLGNREALCADRRGLEVRLQVEELELGRLAEDLDHLLRVLQPREVDHDLVVALCADLGLRDAQSIDAVAQDLDRAVEVGLLQRPVRRRYRLERHLEPALEVEAERRLLLERRAGKGDQSDGDQAGDDQQRKDEVRSTFHGSSGTD